MKNFPLSNDQFNKDLQEWLSKGLGLSDFKEWIFPSGTRYKERDIWWKDSSGLRPSPHEGVDFYQYKTKADCVKEIPAGIKIPLICDGTLIRILPDLIGQSLLFSIDICSPKGDPLYLVYAHVSPDNKLVDSIGKRFSKGDIIAILPDPLKGVPAHLHITIFWASKEFNPDDFDWKTINQNKHIVLDDPMAGIRP